MQKFTLLIHGGAGNIHPRRMTTVQQQAYQQILDAALTAGETILAEGGDALLAVEAAVCVLENSPLFNAGKGSVFTADGTHEMDAAIMDGRTRDAGAVTCVSHIRNPVQAARAVLEHSPHVLLVGQPAEWFARTQGVAWEEAEYFFDRDRWEQLEAVRGSQMLQLDFAGDENPTAVRIAGQAEEPEADKYGTVGAVACDANGHVAAATSTGGLTNKHPGRVGDSAVIGAGVFADDASCAVSCTGQGEFFMRGLVAADVASRMAYGGAPLAVAAAEAINRTLANLGGKGGLIAVDAQGHSALPFNTTGMFRAISRSDGHRAIGMFRHDEIG